VTDSHINGFSDAIKRFWEELPEYILDGDHINAPPWFMKALRKDGAT
jgi:hypothetical protein